MKVTGIHVYPIKSLRGIELTDTLLGPQGVQYDRRFMLLSTKRSKEQRLSKMQLAEFPECALFSQELVVGGADGGADGDAVVVRYHPPQRAKDEKDEKNKFHSGMSPSEQPLLRIPLNPATDTLQPLDVDLHGSPANGCRMGDEYDAWFSACFGFDVVLAYIGDGRRAVLGESLKPKRTARPSFSGGGGGRNFWSRLLAYVAAAWTAFLAALGLAAVPLQNERGAPWLTFTDCAPFLVASESSLRNVRARMSASVDVPMYKFRPNIVVDGEGEGEGEWAEDYWGELTVGGAQEQDAVRLLLTSNCARCTSINVDYATGARAQGELGEVLKRLSKDRRVDKGIKYSPVFGRYAFLDSGDDDDDRENDSEVRIAVGDEVTVTRRNSERTTWDWPGL